MLRDGEVVYSEEGGIAITYIKAKDSRRLLNLGCHQVKVLSQNSHIIECSHVPKKLIRSQAEITKDKPRNWKKMVNVY